MAEHLIWLCRTEHNVDEKHCRTLKPVTPVSRGLLLVGWYYLWKFSHRKIKAKFLTFPLGCESSRFMFLASLVVLYCLSCILVMKGQ